MRTVKSIEDAQKVINELLDWKERISTKDQDFHGLRITNAGLAVNPRDYVVFEQLPKIIESTNQPLDLNYGVVYVNDGVVFTDDVIPAYVIMKGREGIPHQAVLFSRVAPSSTFAINFKAEYKIGSTVTTITLLEEDLEMPSGSTDVAVSSNFIVPTPFLGYLHRVYPYIVSDGGASSVTIQLIIKRTKASGN